MERQRYYTIHILKKSMYAEVFFYKNILYISIKFQVKLFIIYIFLNKSYKIIFISRNISNIDNYFLLFIFKCFKNLVNKIIFKYYSYKFL